MITTELKSKMIAGMSNVFLYGKTFTYFYQMCKDSLLYMVCALSKVPVIWMFERIQIPIHSRQDKNGCLGQVALPDY